MKKIYLKSITGERHEISSTSIKLSVLISDMLEDSDEIDNTIPLQFSNIIIIKIIEYSNHFITDPHDSESLTNGKKIGSDLSKYINEWYSNFIDVDINFLGNLLYAADFLHIESLIELCCLKFAHILKEKDIIQLKEMFTVNESSIEEKNEFAQAHVWSYITNDDNLNTNN
jgi:hypothetical protein